MTDDEGPRPLDIPDAATDAPRAILGDEVYSILGRAIIDGRLQPGERLRDVDLAERLGVSRTPVREALQRLERFGLVEVAANRWTRVSTPPESAGQDTQEFMACIVGGAMRLALPRCSDDVLENIVLAADNVTAASESDDMPAILAATVILYQQLIRASGNTIFVTIMREAGLSLQRNLRGWTHPVVDEKERSALYQRMRDAIAARDALEAEACLFELTAIA